MSANMASQPVDIARLPTIDMNKLLMRDTVEHQKLFEAAQSPGIFHLDLSNYNLASVDEMYALSDRYFMQSVEEKEKDVRTDQLPSQDRGYKKSANDETFEMACDELLTGHTPPLTLPAVIADKLALIKDFNEGCRIATTVMLHALSESLARARPDLEVDLETYHSPTLPSDTGLKLIYEPTVARAADVVENKHTDSGTFTVLFYTEWGLHVFLPSESSSGAATVTQEEQQPGLWAYAAPKPDCALVNVADSLQRLSGGVFHSPLHRVTQHEDGEKKRYYLSYFMRPAHKLKEEWAEKDAAAAATTDTDVGVAA